MRKLHLPGAVVAWLILASSAVRAQSGAESSVGYIDSAIPTSQFRLRYDSAFGSNVPDRAEFFYAKGGFFKLAGIDPNAPGPTEIETNVDFQEVIAYFEYSFTPRLSGFFEVPQRFLNPEQNANTNGITDTFVGFKWAYYSDELETCSLQMRVTLPTGPSHRGLGVNHVSHETALLHYRRLTERLTWESEFRAWIPIGGTDFAGNILRYGAGLSYQIAETSRAAIRPVAEVVGWTVLDGQASEYGVTRSAAGDTIVNAKLGVRLLLPWPSRSCRECGEGFSGSDLYVGYGRALTGAVWYEDIIRVEWRVRY